MSSTGRLETPRSSAAARYRVDVTDVPTARIGDRVRRHRTDGREWYLERRAGRTYLVGERVDV